MRKPISAMPWHGDNLRILVVCDDGSVWAWDFEDNEWEWLSDLPGSPSEVVDE